MDETEIEALKTIGIEFPKDFIFSKADWHDLYTTLSRFKFRAYKRRGLDPLNITTSMGRIIKHRRSERGS